MSFAFDWTTGNLFYTSSAVTWIHHCIWYTRRIHHCIRYTRLNVFVYAIHTLCYDPTSERKFKNSWQNAKRVLARRRSEKSRSSRRVVFWPTDYCAGRFSLKRVFFAGRESRPDVVKCRRESRLIFVTNDPDASACAITVKTCARWL